jgi:hypothetical protein
MSQLCSLFIVAFSKDSASTVIDVSKFYGSDVKAIVDYQPV